MIRAPALSPWGQTGLRVLVTGATGFVGGHLIGDLRKRGHEPVALVRPTSETGPLKEADVACRVADLTTGAGVTEAVRGMDAIIHCAGGGLARRTRDLYDNNLRPTEHLLQACTGHVGRFVMLSSYAARGPRAPGGRGETTANPGPLSHYGRSKALAEEATLQRQGDLQVRILRAPGLHGAGERRLLPLLRAAQRGWLTVPQEGGVAAWLHVLDACDALCRALELDAGSGQIYEVDDETPRTPVELGTVIAEVMDLDQLRVLQTPTWVLRLAAPLAEWAAVVGRRAPLLTRDKLKDMLASGWTGDTGRARDELGWAPERDLVTGLRELREWAERTGLLR